MSEKQKEPAELSKFIRQAKNIASHDIGKPRNALEETILELCKRLEDAEAENRLLRRPLESANFNVDGMMAVGNELIGRDKRIKELEAEIKRLNTIILEHKKGHSIEAECEECLKQFWYIDDDPIVCPYCKPEESKP